ncbi:MAG: tRNA(Ile)-lysidine synthase [Chlamydiae bacterium]|nr:tRNA(Ile)-lysidine synthase [Chlamydiota bacterium]
MDLEKSVETFFKKTSRLEKPLLLGFSGGSDSLALAHCLQHLQIPFHVAHFDHGWREKSAEECEHLRKWALSYHISFHTACSQIREKTEVAARDERYQFFEELFQSREFEALVLAHHKGDQVETILKRILEGAHLTNLKGMQSIIYRGEMPVWRPMLEIPKESILKYLQNHQLIPIEDETNFDPKYLRTRMRLSILPKLAEEFGKEVTGPLLSLGKQSQVLQDYLDCQTKQYVPVIGPFGKMWDFSMSHPIEIEHVLSQFFTLSRKVLDQITGALQKGAANHRVHFGGNILMIDRKKLFWIEKMPPFFVKKIPLQSGVIRDEKWEWEIRIEKESMTQSQNWLSWWKGKISLTLPEGDYELAPPSPFFRKRWNTSKVPAFMRESLPMILNEGKPIAEFLAGKRDGKHPLSVTIAINSRR